MYEELDDKNTRQRVLSVSIAYVPSSNRHVGQIAVPLGVALDSGVIIKTDSYTTPKMPFRRCDRDGCYVELMLPEDVINGMAKSGPEATVNIAADDGKAYALRFSLNGFAGAHDAMTGLAKQKAKGPPPGAGGSGHDAAACQRNNIDNHCRERTEKAASIEAAFFVCRPPAHSVSVCHPASRPAQVMGRRPWGGILA